MQFRSVILALACGVGLATGRLDAAVLQGPGASRNDDSLLVRAESLLGAQNLVDARRAAERYEDRHPNDPRGLILLGRIHLAWPVVGRFQAESLFTRAARLDRGNPEPHYYIAEVGVRLGGEDGEEFTHRGVVSALALNPDYRDAWALWQPIYRNDERRRDMIAALARHAGLVYADYRRGQLLAELERYAEAAALLDTVVRMWPDDPGPSAWHARALFALGRDAAGIQAYENALNTARRDTGQVLWRQVRGISSPEEREAFEATAPEQYPAFFRLFWARRVPDLAAPINGRFAEHFHRLAQATHEFALLHPNSRYFRSATYRARTGGLGLAVDWNGEASAAYANAGATQCTGRRNRSRDEMIQAGIFTPPDSTGNPTNREDNIDDRGLIFLRHGAPTFRSIGPHGDSETWCYIEPDGRTLRVSFLRRTGGVGGTGDLVITTMTDDEREAARELLTTDRTITKPRDLAFSFHVASFRATDDRSTEIVVITDPVQGVAALLSNEGREASRQAVSTGPLRLSAPPGPYVLLFDATRAGLENRYRGPARLRDYATGEPSISSILMAGGGTPARRDSMIAASTPKRILAANHPVRVYTEVYDLGARDGSARYTATYTFERLDGFILRASRQRVSAITFQREVPAGGSRVIETLVIDPGQLPSGRYRLRVDITDDVRGIEAEASSVEFRLR